MRGCWHYGSRWAECGCGHGCGHGYGPPRRDPADPWHGYGPRRSSRLRERDDLEEYLAELEDEVRAVRADLDDLRRGPRGPVSGSERA